MSILSRVNKLNKKVEVPKVKYPLLSQMYDDIDWTRWMRDNNAPSKQLETVIKQTKHFGEY